MLAYARCLIDIFYNQMNDHWNYNNYKNDRRRSEDAKSLEAIIKNNNLELPWGENATIDDIADWFNSHSHS
jgi:hypothetical protein